MKHLLPHRLPLLGQRRAPSLFIIYHLLFIISFAVLASCSSDTEDYDPYYNWKARNEAWFTTIADSARTAIAAAQAQYGDQWEEHCAWRMIKSLQKSANHQSGHTTDSICVRIIQQGTGTYSPALSDSVRVSFRGWLMETTNAEGKPYELTFTQTYYGDYNPATAPPQLASVVAFTDGFATALQYMVEGDDWMVYIPQQLFYGETANGNIPAYSTVRFRMQLVAIYPVGTTIPSWK